jgi:hypothetical protein
MSDNPLYDEWLIEKGVDIMHLTNRERWELMQEFAAQEEAEDEMRKMMEDE